ncbi:uncharacterized protein LOC134818791 [Bolinopsis microptera]|uniref:uncharacterized protein LOC134818791 n=1 Tax=Bolinopsis microptera TaxID=2820187 RepID=UPI003079B991
MNSNLQIWWSLDNLFHFCLCLLGFSVVPNYFTWLLSRNVSKLNRPSNLFIWTVKRGCVAVVTVCLPATLLELSSERKAGDVLTFRDDSTVNRYLIFQVLGALKYIILGVLPWMIYCSTQNVKRLSYKIVLLQMSLSFSVTFCLSIGIVNTSPGSQSELVLVSLYCNLCTVAPISLIVWKFLMRWRRQVNSNSDRTPIYSRTCISSVCLLIICTYLPSDFIHMLQLLYRLQILPNLKWADQR